MILIICVLPNHSPRMVVDGAEISEGKGGFLRRKMFCLKYFGFKFFCGGLGSNGDLIEHKASSCFGHGGEAFEVSS